MYVKNRVHSILTDKNALESWKLQQLQALLYRSEKSRDENQKAIHTLQDHIKHYPKSPELEKWKEMLRFNRHDFELHKGEVDLILEAIHDIRDRTIGKQLELFGKETDR